MTSSKTTIFKCQLGLALVFAMTSLNGCGLSPETGGAPLKTVQQVDIERYMGKWYEIAKYPNSFQQNCSGVTADYTLRDDGTVGVLNTCRDADGSVSSTIEGYAEVADATSNSKLNVYFFGPFGAPYWIIDLDEDYQYAVVGDPTRTFLWILSRTPTLDQQIYDDILAKLPDMGFDPARLEPTAQFEVTTP